MKYYEALTEYSPRTITDSTAVFLAGGITGCPDWQSELAYMLQKTNLTLLNPRRKNFPIEDPDASYDQIVWEFQHLRKADVISFWFPKEQIQPIALFELGAWLPSSKRLFVGVEHGYPREQDIIIQSSLIRPEMEIYDELTDLGKALAAL